MELGLVPYRGQGVNALHGAVHQENGFVWTDGKGIFLSPLQLFQGQIENQEHNKLGEFDRGVKSVHWGDTISDGFCYMCVVHDKNISIWKVEGHQPKLAFKQVRKVNIQPIQQGCLWNPGRDILCVLCPQQASLYYSHLKNKGSQVLVQLDRGKIRCGCWLTDGSRLVICVGTTLSIYHWSDVDQAIAQCSYITWTVPRLTGCISALVPISEDRLLYVSELPLESLCKTQDTFLLPDLLHTNSGSQLTVSTPGDGIIKPKGKETSITDTLFNIPRNPDAVVEDSSRIDCIQLFDDKDPEKLSGCNIKGILTPDILLYQKEDQFVIVGSNSQPLLQVFSFENYQLGKYSEICLDKNERPKGITCYPEGQKGREPGILVLVGKKELSDSAFPSSTNTVVMKSVLKFFNLKQGKYDRNKLTHTKSAPSIPFTVATNGNHDNIDYDRITQEVINFNPTITRSVEMLNRNGNNNNTKVGNRASSIDADKQNGGLKDMRLENKHNGFHSNIISSDGEGRHTSEPPKRPVRKKKSLRGQQDVVKKASGVSEATHKPLMEYLSDSSDMSPRELPRELTTKPANYKTDKASVDVIGKCSSGIEGVRDIDSQSKTGYVEDGSSSVSSDRAKLERQRKVRLDSSNNTSVEDNSQAQLNLEPATSIGEEFTREVTLSLSRDANKVLTHGIVELGGTDSNTELEIERTSFDAHKRNFARYDNENFQEASQLPETAVSRYLQNKTKNNSKMVGSSEQFGGSINQQSEIESSDMSCKDRSNSTRTDTSEQSHINALGKSGITNVQNIIIGKDNSAQSEKENVSPVDKSYTLSGKESNKQFQDGRSELSDRGSSEKFHVSNSLQNGRKLSLSMESLEDIDRLLKEQNEKISKLQDQMNKLSRRVDESSCVLPTRYLSVTKPDVVHLVFRCKDGFEIRRKFLLDGGRLQLDQVKQAFSLETLEIYIDDDPCVTGCNIDGYIPLRFESDSVIYITGKPAL